MNHSKMAINYGILVVFLRTSKQNIFNLQVSLFLFVCFEFVELRICPEMYGCHKIFKYKCKLSLLMLEQSNKLFLSKIASIGPL